ncbi:MFS transporter [Marinobacter sp. bablab_jr015]|uniref:MFS transporter n=1 Tax=unclassified Marinobacter TaxID=83889 RepID=UPI003A4C8058
MAYHSSVGCDLGGDQPTGYATPSACFHTPEITITRLVPVLIFAQLLHAASYGALHAVSVQYIQGFFGKHHHGQGQALYSGLTFGAGGALGAWISGFLVDGYSTSAAFWGGAVAMALAIVVTWRGLQPPPKEA